MLCLKISFKLKFQNVHSLTVVKQDQVQLLFHVEWEGFQTDFFFHPFPLLPHVPVNFSIISAQNRDQRARLKESENN
jgi:hypothetical protein